MKTWSAKADQINDTHRKWWLIDATDLILGRLATQVTNILRGKNKPTYTPHVDTGDFVIVINTEKIKLSGNKWTQKKYYRHSRHIGSMKETSAAKMIEKDPSFMVQSAVECMLPKNKLSRSILKKLKTYRGSEHPHKAQKPEIITLN